MLPNPFFSRVADPNRRVDCDPIIGESQAESVSRGPKNYNPQTETIAPTLLKNINLAGSGSKLY